VGDKYLGKRVSFNLCGKIITGEVISTHREYLCNGIHDILEIEPEGERKQIKIQLHRQAVKVLSQ
jgi:hypothetical protein